MPDVPDNLSSFLGLDYHLRYIPLLCKCGLMKERVVKGEKTYMVCQTASAGGYCWSAFFAEFNLNDFETHRTNIFEVSGAYVSCMISFYNRTSKF